MKLKSLIPEVQLAKYVEFKIQSPTKGIIGTYYTDINGSNEWEQSMYVSGLTPDNEIGRASERYWIPITQGVSTSKGKYIKPSVIIKGAKAYQQTVKREIADIKNKKR